MANTTKTAKATKATTGAAARTLTLGATTAKTETNADGTLTLRLTRVIKAPAERIYQCFLDADALPKWMPPHGFTGRVHKLDAKVGGSYKMSFSTINKSWTQAFGGVYKELVPNQRIVHTDRFEAGPNGPPGEMTVTIDLKPVKDGTEVRIEQRGIPAGQMADGAPYGWSQSLDNLAALCEQELPF
jgi:uncharacterized protein YndB with AHSA1/START domain